MSFLDRIRACAEFERGAYLPFFVAGQPVGLVDRAFVPQLDGFPGIFLTSPDAVTLSPSLNDPMARTRAVDGVLRQLAERGVIKGWRDEPYPVSARPNEPPLLVMERAGIPLFGVRAAGVHVNGYVRRGDDLLMWIGKRSLDKATAPGKLDQLVAGGQSADHSIRDTLIKEAGEEADLPPDLALAAKPVGAITYATRRSEGLRRDILYIFDLQLPPDFMPRNHDAEIAEFYLWPIERVITRVRDSDDFKFNCALVVIDFLIRHGLIDHSEPDYLEIVQGLHSG
jgi:hypothetical protein